MTSIEELAKRTQRLEDIEAIKQLKCRYATACDDNYNAEEIAKLFTEDAVWDGRPLFGIYRGRQAIYEHFKQTSLVFAVHYFMSPDIAIEDDKAHARWYLWQAATTRENRAVWLSAYEDDDYIRINGQWLQSHMKLTVNFFTPYEEGWVRKKIIT